MRTSLRPRVLADFEGTWQLDREIVQANDTRAVFNGTAVWCTCTEGLIYHEIGQLKMPQALPMQAERRYAWWPDLEVHFEDGRFFHKVPANGGEATHWCDPDTYKASYDFTDWPRFTVVWKVSGPKKSYLMKSRYQRR